MWARLSDSVHMIAPFDRFVKGEFSENQIKCCWRNDRSLLRYDIRQSRMIYLLRKHDIISVPFMREAYIICAADIIPVRVHHPFPQGTDIIEKTDLHCKSVFSWRSRRDLNPRYPFGVHTISSRARYDHFDTAPYSVSVAIDLHIITQRLPFVKCFFNFLSNDFSVLPFSQDCVIMG